MDVLVDMSHEDLQSIGVTAFGDRHRILRSVKELAHSGGAGEPGGERWQSIYQKAANGSRVGEEWVCRKIKWQREASIMECVAFCHSRGSSASHCVILLSLI